MSNGSHHLISLYLLAINLAAFVAMGADKRRAKTGRWRIPEATLMTLAALGGSLGCLGGMHLFRHKTRKNKFRLGVPALLLGQLLLALYLSGAGNGPPLL